MARTPRPFITTVYRVGPDGSFEADMPDTGLCAPRDARPCRLSVDHRRPRTTGPGFALSVARCATHRCRFTLYPPGHVPYGRRALAPCAPDGAPVQVSDSVSTLGSAPVADDASAAPTPARLEGFRATVFEAALEAAAGQPWQRHGAGPTHRWWGSQHRALRRTSRLLGLDPRQNIAEREQLASVLGVELMVLHEQAARVAAAPGYRARGQAVVHVLEALRPSRFLPERLLECAARAGLCGPAHRWLPEPGVLRRCPFRAVAPGMPACRSP